MTDSDFTVFTGDTTQKMGLPGEIVVFPARSTQLHLLFHFAELAAGMDYSGLVLDELQLHWGVNPTGHVLLYAFVDDGKGGARSLQSCVATIHKKVEEAVNAHSDWRCEILPVQPIDEALRTADRWDMAISFPAELRDCDEATGILRPAPEWRSPPSIMATLATRPDGHTLDVLVSRQYQQINHGGNATIPIQRHPSFLVDDRDVREVLAPRLRTWALRSASVPKRRCPTQ
ncbi:hypothetical protein [Cupriavidus campinensis]|uniref:hypothetical protein n=1 Tax=Cupriavidus campinensis TaxID=151783 RepID=UPI0011EFBD02|nr:hypothetical protein [Cupriavidus campinensis]